MSVEVSRDDDSLTIRMDGQHLVKFDECAEKWFFKNEISLVEFMIALVALNEGKSFQIKRDGRLSDIAPADDLVTRARANH